MRDARCTMHDAAYFLYPSLPGHQVFVSFTRLCEGQVHYIYIYIYIYIRYKVHTLNIDRDVSILAQLADECRDTV